MLQGRNITCYKEVLLITTINFPTEYVRDAAIWWIDRRNARIDAQVENDILEAMKPSIWNLWKGRSREKAIQLLDKWEADCYIGNYRDTVAWIGSIRATVVKDYLRLAETLEEFGVTRGIDVPFNDLFFIKQYKDR